jgi:hypothetical protein
MTCHPLLLVLRQTPALARTLALRGVPPFVYTPTVSRTMDIAAAASQPSTAAVMVPPVAAPVHAPPAPPSVPSPAVAPSPLPTVAAPTRPSPPAVSLSRPPTLPFEVPATPAPKRAFREAAVPSGSVSRAFRFGALVSSCWANWHTRGRILPPPSSGLRCAPTAVVHPNPHQFRHFVCAILLFCCFLAAERTPPPPHVVRGQFDMLALCDNIFATCAGSRRVCPTLGVLVAIACLSTSAALSDRLGLSGGRAAPR